MGLFPNSVRRRLKELRSNNDVLGLRSSFSALKAGFVKTPTVPVLRDSRLDYDRLRMLYYNTDPNLSNGAHLAAPIIDGTADLIGLPDCSFGDPGLDAEIQTLIKNVWGTHIWQIYRNAMRDTNVWVRLRKHFNSPLLAQEEEDQIFLEVIDGDRVQPYHDPVTNELLRVEIETPVFIEAEVWTPALVMATGARAYGRVHTIREIITTDTYYYYDVTTGEYLEDYQINNDWGFVPLIEIFNDYDSALHGGKSELEQVFPFFKALHDLVVGTRTSHSYHADPKVKFKLGDVENFIRNNWPDSFVDGKFTGKVSWRDRDVFFLESTEDAEFIEATLNIGDSVALGEFLIDCICMAAQVTEGILFRAKAEQPTQGGDEFFRFKKKIERKRTNFEPYIQQIVKMATKIMTGQARLPKLSWSAIDIADLQAEGQAANQIVTASEVANRAGVISKNTYAQGVKRFFPAMLDPAQEQAQVAQEQQQEQDQQVELEKKLAEVKASTQPPAGTNAATRNRGGNGRVRPDLLGHILPLVTGGQGD